MKRGNLYTTARNANCNKLVLAQHLDDLAESFMMSVMHNGFLRTMKANYKINAGDLSVIRPRRARNWTIIFGSPGSHL